MVPYTDSEVLVVAGIKSLNSLFTAHYSLKFIDKLDRAQTSGSEEGQDVGARLRKMKNSACRLVACCEPFRSMLRAIQDDI